MSKIEELKAAADASAAYAADTAYNAYDDDAAWDAWAAYYADHDAYLSELKKPRGTNK